MVHKYQHWLKEEHEANHAKVPTLRILSYIQDIPGAHLENIPSIQTPYLIAYNLWTSFDNTGSLRA